MNKFAKFYKKMVIAVTTFFTCVSGVFLLAGAGSPGVRLMVTAIFFISFLNLSVYARELYQNVKQSRPGGVKPEPPKDAAKPGGQGKPGGGGPGGGSRDGGGQDGGGPRRNDQEGDRK